MTTTTATAPATPLHESGQSLGGRAAARIRRLILPTIVALIYAFLYLPALVIVMYSFSKSAVMSWPPSLFTLHWYHSALGDADLTTGLKNSAIVAVSSVTIALLLGVPAAFGFDRFGFWGKSYFERLLVMPFLMPGIVSGITLLTVFIDLSIPLSLRTVVIGHASMLIAVFVIQVQVGLARWDKQLEAAAMDLGANEVRTFLYVLLPNLSKTILGACLLGITVSLDEIARTFFLTGTDNTLPMVIWSKLHQQLTPQVNAVASIILGVSLAAMILWSRVTRLPSWQERPTASSE